MLRTVVLEHMLPDGSAHFDWMVEDPRLAAEHRLATWRTLIRPDRAGPGDSFSGDRIGAHRAHYLTYEGPLSDERGRVRRLGAGSVEWVRHEQTSIGLLIRWDHGPSGRYSGRADGPVRWSWLLVPD